MFKSFPFNKITYWFKNKLLQVQNIFFFKLCYAWYILLTGIISYNLQKSKKFNHLKNYLFLKYLLIFNKEKLDPKMYELTVFQENAALRYYKSFIRGFLWGLLLFYCYYAIPQTDGVKSIKKAVKIFFSMLF